MSDYLSIALDLRGRRCLVVGAGQVGERKLQALLQAGADDVVVIAPRMEVGVLRLAETHPIELRMRPFVAEDLTGAFLAMIATPRDALNHEIAVAARAQGALVNVADDPDYCDFIMPATVQRGNLGLAISTGGASPAFARFMRELIEDLIPSEYGELLDITRELRAELRGQGVTVDPELWQIALHGEALEFLRAGNAAAARVVLRRAVGSGPEAEAVEGSGVASGHPTKGRLVLAGAGPGDPGLITIAGRDAIAGADVILYDRLANTELLGGAPRARLIYVGKGPDGRGPMTQDEINELIVAEAHQGKVVVRLKGGDPFVFGRGGEEALAAVAAGVPFTVIPGVSAATAVPAYAGIPVTQRGLASAFTVVTGQQGSGAEPLNWEAIVRFGGTLVLLMGVETLPAIVAELLDAGMDPGTPAAVIEQGTLPDQRVVTGALAEIDTLVREAGISSPATTVVGAVAGLAHDLQWTGTTPSPLPS